MSRLHREEHEGHEDDLFGITPKEFFVVFAVFVVSCYDPHRGATVAELKTRATGASVSAFINAIPEDQRRRDCHAIAEMMEKATGSKPKMWGTSIVGFGDVEYVNSTKKPQKWFRCGFSPRKQALTLYLMGGYAKDPQTAKKLGKFKVGGGCLYIKSLDDVHVPTLRAMLTESLKRIKADRIDYSK